MQEKHKRSLLFVASVILLAINISQVLDIGTVSNFIELSSMLLFALFIASSFIYILFPSRLYAKKHYGTASRTRTDGVIAWLERNTTYILLLIDLSLLLIVIAQSFVLSELNFAHNMQTFIMVYTVNALLFLLSISLILLGVRFGAEKALKGRRLLSYSFLLAAILVIILFFASGAVFYINNDETFIGIQAFKTLLAGSNPYTMNISAQVYNAYLTHNITAPTITSKNTVVGNLEYPLLYVISLAPFIYSHNAHTASHILLPLEIGVFLILFLLSMFKSMNPKPDAIIFYGFILSMPFFITSIISPTSALILALLILSFWKSDSKYSGILFGITASIQQLTWIPLLLLVVYIFNNRGSKRAAVVMLTMAATFLLINAYPLLLNFGAFFGGIFAPASGSIIPSGGLFGYYLLTIGVPTHIALKVYFVMIAVSAVIMLFFNKKLLIGPLSLLPFMFLDRGLGMYYLLFLLFTLATLLIRNNGQGEQGNPFIDRLRNHKRAAMLLTASILIVFVLLTSYILLPRPQPFSFYNASVSGGGGNMIYSVYASAGPTGQNKTFSVLLQAMMTNSSYISSFGLFGSNVLYVDGGPSIKPGYVFSSNNINSNILDLHNSSAVHIQINASDVSAARCILYNATTFILCPVAKVEGS